MGIPIGGKTIPLFVVSKNSSGTKKLPNNGQFLPTRTENRARCATFTRNVLRHAQSSYGAEGGSRTHTPRGRVILSHVRLPFRHFGKLFALTIIKPG